MNMLIKLILENFTAATLLLALGLAFVARRRQSAGEALARYMLLLPVGLGGIWGFYYHVFQPQMTAEMIGWQDSPFQYEVGVANLGMGLAGLIGFWRSRDYSAAVAIMVSCFLWGAAANHIKLIFTQGDFSPGNAGAILVTDILIPLLLWVGIVLWKKSRA